MTLVAVAVVAALGCGTGAMQQSRMAAGPDARQPSIQGPLAVGASIAPRIDLDIQGSGAPLMRLVSAHPEVLEAGDHRLIGRAPGVSAVLITTDNGVVLDFIHLWVVEPTRIQLEVLSETRARRAEIRDAIELLVGDDLIVKPVMYAHNQELWGMAESMWSTSEPIVTVLRDGEPNRRRLVAREPGRTRVSVQTLGLEASFDLVVVP